MFGYVNRITTPGGYLVKSASAQSMQSYKCGRFNYKSPTI